MNVMDGSSGYFKDHAAIKIEPLGISNYSSRTFAQTPPLVLLNDHLHHQHSLHRPTIAINYHFPNNFSIVTVPPKPIRSPTRSAIPAAATVFESVCPATLVHLPQRQWYLSRGWTMRCLHRVLERSGRGEALPRWSALQGGNSFPLSVPH